MAMTVNGTSGLTFNDGTTQSSAAGGIVPNVRFSDGTIQSSAAIPAAEVIRTTMFGSTGSFTRTFNKFFMVRSQYHRNCGGTNQWHYGSGDSGWINNAGNGAALHGGYGQVTCNITCWLPVEIDLGSFSSSLNPTLSYSNLTLKVTANFAQNTDDGCMTRIGNSWGATNLEASFGSWANNPWCNGYAMQLEHYLTRTLEGNIIIPKANLLSGTSLKLLFAARIPGGSSQEEGVGLKDVTVSFVSWS